MRFCQLDRITELEVGKRIVATRKLRADEDYLKDHFPLFPVMPGVLMLEGMFQACSWLVRASHDFKPTVVDLLEARNVKYADFMQPGDELQVTAEIMKEDDRTVTLKAQGVKGSEVAVSARLVVGKTNLCSEENRDGFDARVRLMWLDAFKRLYTPPAS